MQINKVYLHCSVKLQCSSIKSYDTQDYVNRFKSYCTCEVQRFNNSLFDNVSHKLTYCDDSVKKSGKFEASFQNRNDLRKSCKTNQCVSNINVNPKKCFFREQLKIKVAN